jgi:hypothetical protein
MTAVLMIALGGLLDAIGLLALRDVAARGDQGRQRRTKIGQREFAIALSGAGTVLMIVGLILLLG